MRFNITIIITLLFILNTYNLFPQSKILTLDELCTYSNEIAVAKLIKIDTYFDSDNKRVFTDYTYKVLEKIEGNLSVNDNFIITLYGGKYKGNTTFSPDYPAFTVDQKSLLFLNLSKSQIPQIPKYAIVGLKQGKFDILTNSNNEEIIRRGDEKYLETIVFNNYQINTTNITLKQIIDIVKQIFSN